MLLTTLKNKVNKFNGWQRIWLVLVVLNFIAFSLFFYLYFPYKNFISDESNLKNQILLNQKWIEDNKNKCNKAYKFVDAFKKDFELQNEINRANYDKDKEQIKREINIAEEALGQADIKGDTHEWLRQNAKIRYLRDKLNKLHLFTPLFEVSQIKDYEISTQYELCKRLSSELDQSIYELGDNTRKRNDYYNDILSHLLGYIFSFLVTSISVYAIGFALGWIYRGFKNNQS